MVDKPKFVGGKIKKQLSSDCNCGCTELVYNTYWIDSEPGSSVGIATDYGLDGPGLESRWGEIFHPSRPALGPSQHPVKWVSGIPGDKVWPGRNADHSNPSSAEVLKE
jgi:hypothetical protein